MLRPVGSPRCWRNSLSHQQECSHEPLDHKRVELARESCFLTGPFLLGRWDDLSGYDTFVQTFNTTMASETGFVDGLLAVGKLAVLEWGFAMWVGSIPWAALFGWIGYRVSLRFVIAYRMARARRLERRLASQRRRA